MNLCLRMKTNDEIKLYLKKKIRARQCVALS